MVDKFSYGYDASLFPMTKSGEDKATSIFFAILNLIQPFRDSLLKTIGKRAYKNKVDFKATLHPSFGGNYSSKDIPDGLIQLNQKENWSALVEVKIKGNDLSTGQLTNYLKRVKENKLSALITISNELCSAPDKPPLRLKSSDRDFRKIDHFHWSWRYILFHARNVLKNGNIETDTEKKLLSQFISFLEHEKSGISGFNSMPNNWGKFTHKLRDGGIPDQEMCEEIVGSWFQETSELALILSDELHVSVNEAISSQTTERRIEEAVKLVKEHGDLRAEFCIENHNYPLTISLDVDGRRLQFSTKHDLPTTAKTPYKKIEHFLKYFFEAENGDEWGGHENVRIFAYWPHIKQPTDMTMFDAIQHSLDNELKNSTFINDDKDRIMNLELCYTPAKVSSKIMNKKNVITLIESEIVFFVRNYVVMV